MSMILIFTCLVANFADEADEQSELLNVKTMLMHRRVLLSWKNIITFLPFNDYSD